MRKILWLAMLCCIWGVHARADSESDIVAARVKTFEAGLPKDHPRLLLKKSELPQFRAFVSNWRASNEGAALWKKLAIEPSGAPLPPEPQALPAKKGANAPEIAKLWKMGYDTANDTGNTAWRFALMYLVTGEEKYGREAARWLMHLASWRADKSSFRNNDEQFIQATRPMIFAYDWVYDVLTPEERTVLEKTLISRMELMSDDQKRLFSLIRPTAPNSSLSHPMRFISTVGQGGLALFFEQKAAPSHLAWAYEYYNRQFPVWGGEDGGWAEGLEYWSSGNSQHQRFLDGMKQLGFDEPLKRGFFRNNAYFGMFNLMPYPASSFGDLTNIVNPSNNHVLLLEKYALMNNDPYPLAFGQKLAKGYPSDMGYYTFNAIDTLFHVFRKDQAKLPEVDLATLPQSRYFADIGWVAMHSKLGDKDNDIMLLLKSSSYGSASHSHNDQNAFVINAFGEPLAIQSGYRDWYDSAHHMGWTRLTHSKNAILVDGKGQPSKDPDAKGDIRNYRSGDQFTFATGDAGPAYKNLADSALRHVFFVNRRYFVLLDEVVAKSKVNYQWLLHAREPMKLDPVAGVVTSSKGKANLQVSFLVPAGNELKFSQTDAFFVPIDPSSAKGKPNEWHMQAETLATQSRGEFLTVLYPWKAGDTPAGSSRIPAGKGFAAQVGDDVILFARSAEQVVSTESAALNGYAAYTSRPGGALSRFAAVEATLLQQGELLLRASQPLTLEGSRMGKQWVLQLQPHPALELQMALSAPPKTVSGVATSDWRYDTVNKLLVVKLAENQSRLVIEQ